jgi:hypothetical protein
MIIPSSLLNRKIKVVNVLSTGTNIHDRRDSLILEENAPVGMAADIIQGDPDNTSLLQIKFWRRKPVLINQNLSKASLSHDGRFALYQSLWLPKSASQAPPDGVKNEGSEYVVLQLLNPIGPCDP